MKQRSPHDSHAVQAAFGAIPMKSTPATLLALLWTLTACGESPTPPAASVAVTPAAVFLVGGGATAALHATVEGGHPVEWSSADRNVVTVDAVGTVTAVATGTTTVTARAGGASGTSKVEVWAPAPVARYEAGTSYFGRARYVEYIPGELPLILSAPHGGDLTPAEIPDRTWGTSVTDTNLRETTLAVREALIQRTGKAPHVILSHLKRTKLDPNREIVEAAQGNPFAENAWNEFQGFIEVARSEVAERYGSGFYLDLHGHGHAIARAELGYLLGATQLGLGDAALDAGGLGAQSSIRALAEASPLSFSALLRGASSFGAYLAAEGVPSVPSPAAPSPGEADYFSGGYNTDRHGSRRGGTISGLQIELHRPGVRDTDENRRAFAAALAKVVEAYMLRHWGFFAEPRP